MSTLRAVVRVGLLSLLLVACRLGEGAVNSSFVEPRAAAEVAISHLKEQGFSYNENEQEIFVSGGNYDGQAVWLASVLPKNYTPVKSRKMTTTSTNGKEVQLEKITPNGPANGPTVTVSKAEGSVVIVRFDP